MVFDFHPPPFVGFNRFKPSSKIFLLTVPRRIIYVISVFCLLCFRVRLFSDALWLPAGKWLISWLSLVLSYCEFVTSAWVSWSGVVPECIDS